MVTALSTRDVAADAYAIFFSCFHVCRRYAVCLIFTTTSVAAFRHAFAAILLRRRRRVIRLLLIAAALQCYYAVCRRCFSDVIRHAFSLC